MKNPTDFLPRPERPSRVALATSCAIAAGGYALTGFTIIGLFGYPVLLLGLFGIYLALAPDSLLAHGFAAGSAFAMGKAMGALLTLLIALLSGGRESILGPIMSTGFWYLLGPTLVARTLSMRSRTDDTQNVNGVYYTALSSAGMVTGFYLAMRLLGLPVSN